MDVAEIIKGENRMSEIKFIYGNDYENYPDDGTKIEITTKAVGLDRLIEVFEQFISAIGYTIEGNLDFVDYEAHEKEVADSYAVGYKDGVEDANKEVTPPGEPAYEMDDAAYAFEQPSAITEVSKGYPYPNALEPQTVDTSEQVQTPNGKRYRVKSVEEMEKIFGKPRGGDVVCDELVWTKPMWDDCGKEVKPMEEKHGDYKYYSAEEWWYIPEWVEEIPE
jgi:hypothetical protein